MVIAENLQEDSSRNSLEKIFGVVGRSVRKKNLLRAADQNTSHIDFYTIYK
jgi:hypothetical protein